MNFQRAYIPRERGKTGCSPDKGVAHTQGTLGKDGNPRSMLDASSQKLLYTVSERYHFIWQVI